MANRQINGEQIAVLALFEIRGFDVRNEQGRLAKAPGGW